MGRLRFELSRLGRHRLSEERWRSPQRIASRTLFCDDLVYLEGGRPLYFGVRGATLGNPAVSFEVGSAEVDDLPAVSRYLSGPRRRARREAGCQLLLFGMENMDDDVDLLRRRGFGVTFRSRAEADAEVRSHRDACEFCADALIRKAAAATRRRSIQEPESMLHRKVQAPENTGATLSRRHPHYDRGVSRRARFGVKFEYAAESLTRLDAIHTPVYLSELDKQALIIVNSVVIA